MPTPYCPKCGTAMPEGQAFCARCGAGQRQGFVQRHLLLTIVLVVIIVACLLPMFGTCVLTMLQGPIDSQFDRTIATLEAAAE